MNTITIDSKIYKGAEIYARLHNINVKDFIEKAIVAAVGNSVEETPQHGMKTEAELSSQVKSLIGVARDADTDDIDGRKAHLQHLLKKQ